MYVDAAEYHRTTTAAVRRRTRLLRSLEKAVKNAPTKDSRQRLLEQRNQAADELRHSMQVDSDRFAFRYIIHELQWFFHCI